jgi:hypothetical protein
MREKLTKKQIIKKVQEYLEENRLMTLGVCWSNKPWGATVFYAYDEKLNLLFYSRPDTKHCQYIHKNPNVSVVINHNWRYLMVKSEVFKFLVKQKRFQKEIIPFCLKFLENVLNGLINLPKIIFFILSNLQKSGILMRNYLVIFIE